MAISIYVGDTAPIYFPLSYSDGTKPNLSGFVNANFTLHLYNPQGPTTTVCAGNFTIAPNASNTVIYNPLSTEVAAAGAWQVWLTVHFPGYDKTWTFDTINIVTKF